MQKQRLTTETPGAASWYRSFYWRIGFSFAACVIVVVLAQSGITTYLTSQSNERTPNNLAAIVAADIGSLLTHDPTFDLEGHLRADYGNVAQPIFVLMKDGRLAANTSRPLNLEVRRSIEGLLHGTDFKRSGELPAMPGPLMVTTPIQVGNELRGMVLLPPPDNASPIARQVQRLLSVPGTAILIVVTVAAVALVFAPARRRLKALEDAARRLGRGDLGARAPEGGGDEIAHLAVAFNRMADELAARDAELRTSDRLRRQMLADVSHELRTPLTSMLGFLDTLNMSELTLDQATRTRYLVTIERETRRLDRLVHDLLDLARLENGVGALEVRLFAIRRVFDHVVERHAEELRVRRLLTCISVEDAADQVVGDPDRIEQVMENLFANAMRHTTDGGTIELAATVRDGVVVLSVKDSGPGILPEHLPHVFKRFYKADAARAGSAGGSGLGLSISKAIVERHSGTIEVSSAPGETVFTVRLPAEARPSVHVGELVANTPGGE